MAGFDEATALHPVGDGTFDTFDAELDGSWSIGGKLNGGYLLALLGRAACVAVGSEGHPHPVAASAHFLHAPDPGPARVEVAVLRAGRTLGQVRASLHAGGRHCVEAVVSVGALDGGTWWDGVPPVELPAIESCPRLPVQGPGFEVPLMAVVAEHLDPAVMGWAVGRPSGAGELRGWAAHAEGREPDPVSLLMFADALPPATFDLGSAGWVPTLELTCHVRAVPAPGPVVVRQRVRHVSGGRVDEECDVWDSTGRLVATGHQLAGVRIPEGQAPATRR